MAKKSIAALLLCEVLLVWPRQSAAMCAEWRDLPDAHSCTRAPVVWAGTVEKTLWPTTSEALLLVSLSRGADARATVTVTDVWAGDIPAQIGFDVVGWPQWHDTRFPLPPGTALLVCGDRPPPQSSPFSPGQSHLIDR